MKKVNYDTNVYDFSGIISNIFNFSPLNKLHTEKDFSELIKQSVNNTHEFQQSKYHQLYYNNFNLVNPTYTKLIEDVIKPLYGGERIVYQNIPTFRIHFPDGMSVGMFHKDKYLRDDKWHESIKEDNFYLPCTNAYDTNTVWVESEEDKADYKPMTCDYGNLIQWDGTNLSHGNKINKTNDTRISVDFRVAMESNFKNNENNSKNNKTIFTVGGYYNII